MQIDFDNPKHETLVNDYNALSRRYDRKGQRVAADIIETINVLFAADSLFDVPRSHRPHPLKGIYKRCFAADVTQTHRVIFKPNHNRDSEFRIDNPKTITKIIILEIYHDYH